MSNIHVNGCQPCYAQERQTEFPKPHYQQSGRYSHGDVSTLKQKLRSFVNECDEVISSLNTAHAVEYADALTDDNTGFGAAVNLFSWYQNRSVSNKTDELQQLTDKLNIRLKIMKADSGLPLMKLNSHFSGKNIREAEEAESSLLGNFFGGRYYDASSSMNTANTISSTINKVQRVKEEAEYNIRVLKGL